ncbi:hypothetical protein DL767_002752 [Monosporascus sp. MG133]|nr:hypothetical protein DL767_002752 [Monosporascus sp. MG133]
MAAPRQDNRVPPPSSLLSAYSDASSSYWPPGWSFDRYARATAEDNAALPGDERAKMQAGFRDVLGEDGVAEMARVVWQEQLRVKKLEEATSSSSLSSSSAQGQRRRQPPPPDWLKTWRKRYQGQPWGFVAFRTATATATATTNSDVEEFQTRVREIVEIPFDAALEQGQPADEVAKARSTFEIRWVEVGEEGEETKAEESHSRRNIIVADPVERLRTRYRAMRESGSLPPGLCLPTFLCASPAAVASVLSTPLGGDNNGEKPGTTSPRWRSGAPFLLAVAAEEERGVTDDEADESVGGGGEKDWFKPVFKVATEVLVDELWWVVEEQITSLGKLTRFVREAAVTDGAEAAEGEKEKEGEKRPGGGHGRDDGDRQGEEPGHDDDGLDDIWWSVHMPPHRMRKRRRVFASE